MKRTCRKCLFDDICPGGSPTKCDHYSPLDEDETILSQAERMKTEYRKAWEEYAGSTGNPSLFSY